MWSVWLSTTAGWPTDVKARRFSLDRKPKSTIHPNRSIHAQDRLNLDALQIDASLLRPLDASQATEAERQQQP
jgi:hypothetical protein